MWVLRTAHGNVLNGVFVLKRRCWLVVKRSPHRPRTPYQEVVIFDRCAARCASTCEERLPTVYGIWNERGTSYTAFVVYGGILYAVIGVCLVYGGAVLLLVYFWYLEWASFFWL